MQAPRAGPCSLCWTQSLATRSSSIKGTPSKVKGDNVDDEEEGRGSVRDLVARQAPGEPDVTQLMNNPGLAAGAGRAQATQTDLVNYWLQKASGPKTNPCRQFQG